MKFCFTRFYFLNATKVTVERRIVPSTTAPKIGLAVRISERANANIEQKI